MKLQAFPQHLTICQVGDLAGVDLTQELFFLGRTDEELSLVCPTDAVPERTLRRDDGWRAFRICGVLDFSLIGILAPIASLMADNGIGIFAVSTYNTDYVLVRQEHFERALALLSAAGYDIV
jgi:hypothetical protein